MKTHPLTSPLTFILSFLWAALCWIMFAISASGQPALPAGGVTNHANRVTNNLVGFKLGNDVDTQAGKITTSSPYPWVSKLDNRFYGGTYAKSSSAVPATGSNDSWMEIEFPMGSGTNVSVPHRIMFQYTMADSEPGVLTNVFTVLFKAHASDPYQTLITRKGRWTDNQDLWIDPFYQTTVTNNSSSVFFKFRLVMFPLAYSHTYAAVDWIQWEAVPQTLHKLRMDTTGGNALGDAQYIAFGHGEYGHGWEVSWYWPWPEDSFYLQYAPAPGGPWTTATNYLWQNSFTMRQWMYFPHDTTNKFFRLHQ